MARHIRVPRWRAGVAALSLLAASAAAADLVDHNGFEACWSQAITEATFLNAQQAAIDGVKSCVPESSGVGYSACSLPHCEGGTTGCPVTTHAGPFSGTFTAGSGNQFTSTGSADDIVIDIAYTGGSCTITASNILLDYALDYTLQGDGNNGLYAASLDQSTLTVHDGYVLVGSDATCDGLIAIAQSTLISQIESSGAAGIAALEEPATVGESVCPLTP